jgi:hypothetical protein
MQKSKTNHAAFDRDGFFVIKDIIDPSFSIQEIPTARGSHFSDKNGNLRHFPDDPNELKYLMGRYSRYAYPLFKDSFYDVKKKLETVIGKKLYPTYWFDRYYFDKSTLPAHTDRDSCEISVSIQLSSNLENPWSFGIEDGDGMPHLFKLNDGDGVVYKGCERLHWRSKFPVEYDTDWKGKKTNRNGLYHHQVFFHYVLQDGFRSHHAWDRQHDQGGLW